MEPVGQTGKRRCKPCFAAYMVAYRRARPDYADAQSRWQRESHLKRTYGITCADYDAMLTAQGRRCAACGTLDPSATGRPREGWRSERPDWSFAVDHCHMTGKVRGLLCHPCNRAIGQAKEDPKILRALADYLDLS